MRISWKNEHFRCHNVTYLLISWCRVLLEKLTGLQLVKKFPAFHGTRRLITALTYVRHLSLSSASPIQSIYPHPTSWRSILTLSTHLRLVLPSGLLPSVFPAKTLYAPSPQPYAPHAQPIYHNVNNIILWTSLPVHKTHKGEEIVPVCSYFTDKIKNSST